MFGEAKEKSRTSVSLADLVERALHLQKRLLDEVFRCDKLENGRSAQKPSGNHTYSYPSRGGLGGSTPKADTLNTFRGPESFDAVVYGAATFLTCEPSKLDVGTVCLARGGARDRMGRLK